MTELTIRRALPSDKHLVMEISRTVWEGNDYLPDIWDRWIAEPESDGLLMAGEMSGRLVAIQHIDFQAQGVAWMEGIRVAPEYRNQGIGGQMLGRALDLAREHGAAKARLTTAELNPMSSAIARAHELREVARFHIYTIFLNHEVLPSSGEDRNSQLTINNETVDDNAFSKLRFDLGDDETLIINQWTAYDVPGQISTADFPISLTARDQGELVGSALAIPSRNGKRLSLSAVYGDRPVVAELGRTVARDARSQGYVAVQAMLIGGPERGLGLVDAGFVRNEELVGLLFERSLTASDV